MTYEGKTAIGTKTKERKDDEKKGGLRPQSTPGQATTNVKKRNSSVKQRKRSRSGRQRQAKAQTDSLAVGSDNNLFLESRATRRAALHIKRLEERLEEQIQQRLVVGLEDRAKNEKEERSKRTTDTSAVGGDQGERSGSPSHSKRPRSRSLIRLRANSPSRFGPVFARGSVLRQLLGNVWLSDYDISKRPLSSDARVLFLFDCSYDDTRLQDHNWPSMREMKAQLNDASFQFGRLLDDVPKRPVAKNQWRPLAPTAREDMRGLLSKFNLQYRRPYIANHDAELEVWNPVRAALGAQLSAQYFHIHERDLESTVVFREIDRNKGGPNSMVVNTFSGKMVRTVVGISFPALCLLLQEVHNAVDIERAWTEMPMVRCGKANTRGTSTTSSHSGH